MRLVIITFCLVLFANAGFSQGNGGVFGLLSDKAARLVANAPIEARNIDSGARFETSSGETGLYRLNGLPSGTYEISVSITGAGNFVQQRVRVADVKPVRFDIILPLE
jgi:hypothetical protein